MALIARLRAPDGCAWDREQRLPDLRAYLVEEAHEAAAAIDAESPAEIADELGDLLFLAVFAATLNHETGGPSPAATVDAAIAKIVARHPHVFSDGSATDAESVRRAWERKKAERRGAAGESLLAGVPASLPALTAAYRLGQKAAGIGFDWPHAEAVLEKVDEERAELGATIDEGQDHGRQREEIGDLLFALSQLARHLDIDPEAALASANRKFRRRFAALEESLRAAGRSIVDATPRELEEAWEEGKRAEARPDADR